jgi:hypothetical protein
MLVQLNYAMSLKQKLIYRKKEKDKECFFNFFN